MLLPLAVHWHYCCFMTGTAMISYFSENWKHPLKQEDTRDGQYIVELGDG